MFRSIMVCIVWEIVDKYLCNIVDEEDYGDYILLFMVFCCFECMLVENKDDVIKYVEIFIGMFQYFIDIVVKDWFGLGFYNVLLFNFVIIVLVDDNVDKFFKSYVDGFLNNIVDIWVLFDFNWCVKVFGDVNCLYVVVKYFFMLLLGLKDFSDIGMGDVFEDVMY